MGKYHVTVGQYRRFVLATGHQSEAERAGDARTWKKPGLAQTDEYPVVCVSWNDADAFCRWLAKGSGAAVRLPREAEWEYACRSGTTTRFYFGDNEADLGDYAWYDKNSGNCTHPSGLKKPNDFGLYDMHGLVWQWCVDGKRSYRDRDETDPEGPTTAATAGVNGGREPPAGPLTLLRRSWPSRLVEGWCPILFRGVGVPVAGPGLVIGPHDGSSPRRHVASASSATSGVVGRAGNWPRPAHWNSPLSNSARQSSRRESTRSPPPS
jgi:formylglycine-generating enzyme required for sulfatase activity